MVFKVVSSRRTSTGEYSDQDFGTVSRADIVVPAQKSPSFDQLKKSYQRLPHVAVAD